MDWHTYHPATGTLLATYSAQSHEQWQAACQKAFHAHESWVFLTFKERQKRLSTLIPLLKKQLPSLSHHITLEMGKPIAQAQAELEKCLYLLEYYTTPHFLELLAPHWEQSFALEALQASIVRQPLGVIFSMTPWNYPIWQAFRSAIPNLLAGNGVLTKTAPNTTGCLLECFSEVIKPVFPDGLWELCLLDNSQIKAVIAHHNVAGVMFTGSTETGRLIANYAGHALKPVLLELGGSDPYLICADADLEKATHSIVASRLQNNGQACIAAKRVLFLKSQERQIIHALIESMKTFSIGDPLQLKTQIGPLARAEDQARVKQQLEKLKALGGECLYSSSEIPEQGFYCAPELWKVEQPLDEEIFAPILCAQAADNEEQMLALANGIGFGLGAGVFSTDIERAHRLAKRLRTGNVAINGMVRSHPALPFGGLGTSGYGREMGISGVLYFTQEQVTQCYA